MLFIGYCGLLEYYCGGYTYCLFANKYISWIKVK